VPQHACREYLSCLVVLHAGLSAVSSLAWPGNVLLTCNDAKLPLGSLARIADLSFA